MAATSKGNVKRRAYDRFVQKVSGYIRINLKTKMLDH
jgi:hypothetical protein